MADDVEEMVTQKYGGIPLWAWGAGLAAIVVAYFWWRNQSTVTTAPQTETVDNTTGEAPGLIPAGTDSNVSSPGSSDTGDTSSDWLSQALAAVQGSGVDQYTALQSLSKFMEGSQLTASDVKTIDAAIGSVGLPPGYSSSTAPVAATNVSPTSPDEVKANAALAAAQKALSEAKTTAQKAAAQVKVNAALQTKLAAQKKAQAATAAKQAASKKAAATAAAKAKAEATKLAVQAKAQAAEAKKLAAQKAAQERAKTKAAKISTKPTAAKKPATATAKTYTIKAGDTLSQLAQKFYPNMSITSGVKKLAKTNGIANPDLIYVGHTLKY